MDWWIYRQLRSSVISDLREFVPVGYFEEGKEAFSLDSRLPNAERLSLELYWGCRAGALGKKLFFDSSLDMTARQRSACDVLMNLGMLIATEAAQNITNNLSEYTDSLGVSDDNSAAILEQLGSEHIPTAKENVKGALKLYINHIPEREASIYNQLIDDNNRPATDLFFQKIKKPFTWFLNNILTQVITGVMVAIIGVWIGLGGT